jgi:integrase
VKGNLTERPPGSGVWRFRVYTGRRRPNGTPIYATRTWKNVVKGKLVPGGDRAAQTALAAFVTEVDQKRNPSAETLGEILDRWLAFIEPNRAASTMRGYRQKVEKDIKPGVGHLRLDKLRALDLDTWYAEKEAGGLSARSVHHFHAIIHAALHQAVKWGLVPLNEADRCTPPSPKSMPVRVPSVESVGALLAESERRSPNMSILLILGATTGARRSELVRLRWSDVDWQSRTLRIRGTKNETSYRTVNLDDLAMLALELHRQRVLDTAAKALVDLVPDPYIGSPDPQGRRPFTASYLTTAVRRWTANGVSPQQLRHFTATQLLGANVDVRTVAGRLGHADATTTLRVYAHFIPERDRVAADFMGSLVGPTPAQRKELERRAALQPAPAD